VYHIRPGVCMDRWSMVMRSGDAAGLGALREKELRTSCKILQVRLCRALRSVQITYSAAYHSCLDSRVKVA